jgi:hypothetical protein
MITVWGPDLKRTPFRSNRHHESVVTGGLARQQSVETLKKPSAS